MTRFEERSDHPDAADPLVLDSRRLPRQPGASLRTDAVVDSVDGVRNDVIGVPPGVAVTVSLLLESVLDGILVTAVTELPQRGTCVRCLADIDRAERVEFRQFFAYPGAEPEGAEDDLEDVTPLHGPWLDLRPAFRDAALLALPLSPTCRADCPGLCPECGFRMADDPEHRHLRSDTRWDALAALRDRQPEGE
jgi:uncharacterized protein